MLRPTLRAANFRSRQIKNNWQSLSFVYVGGNFSNLQFTNYC